MQQRNSAVLAAAALAIATIGTATIGTGAASASGTTVVQVPRRNCSAPEPGHAACLSIRLVNKRVSRAAAAKMRADGRARPSSVKKLADGPAGGYTPAQLAKAYGINPAAATTQTVAIVDAYSDPTVRADLNTFDKKYGIPTETSTSFKAVGQTGGAVPAPPASGTPNAGWADEITLDVQAVRAMCHHCKILLVETKSNNDPDLAAGVNYAAKHASIISNSYGEPEKGANQSKATAAAYNHKGVAILASTGDDGWFDWDFFNLNNPNNPEPPDTPETSSNSPELPASQRSVIGVGGTSLYLNPDGTRASETVWNDNGPADYYGWYDAYNYGAGGSGCSTLYAPNAWQKSVAGYATLGCGAKRSAVDIAADADYLTGFDICQNFNNTDSAKCGWSTIGGTSLASPLVAGMWGLAGGPGKVSYPALSLYGNFKSTSKSTYDVVTGGNDICGTATLTTCLGFGGGQLNTLGFGRLACAFDANDKPVANRYQCHAEPGYDGVSGVGTPAGLSVFKPLSPLAKLSVGGTVTHGKAHTFSAAASRSPFPGGKITKYVWAWGDGTTTTTTKATASHKFAKAGKRTVRVTVSDNYGTQNNGRTGTTTAKVTVK